MGTKDLSDAYVTVHMHERCVCKYLGYTRQEDSSHSHSLHQAYVTTLLGTSHRLATEGGTFSSEEARPDMCLTDHPARTLALLECTCSALSHAVQDGNQGMMPPTVGRSSCPKECNPDTPPQTCPEAHFPGFSHLSHCGLTRQPGHQQHTESCFVLQMMVWPVRLSFQDLNCPL
ncbi:hypothetical protein STEG23_020029 [Scotinomys teguina]